MSEMDDAAMRLLTILSELAKDHKWTGAWATLLDGSPSGAAALAEWLQQQPPEKREQLRALFNDPGGIA